MSSLIRKTRSQFLLGPLGLAAAACALLAQTALAQSPRGLADLVLGAGRRPIVERELAGERWQSMAAFHEQPYLWWPAAAESKTPTRQTDAAARWIDERAAALGHSGFMARYAHTKEWRGNEVFVYELYRNNLPLHDARIELHFDGERFVGLVHHVPTPWLAITDEWTGASDAERVYVATPAQGGSHVQLQALERRRQGNLVFTTIGTSVTVGPISVPAPSPITPEQFKEWVVPVGNFPDQIDVGDDGIVWFSQPSQNYLTSFNPKTEVFTRFTTNGGSGPDGMTLDANGIVWTGLYFAGGLGRLDPQTGVHTAIAAPYGGASLAVPTAASTGTIWITDHNAVRISQYNPATNTWPQSVVMPTAGSWPVNAAEDPATQKLYITCYSANKIAIVVPGVGVSETNSPAGGPAFGVWSNGKYYYTLWTASRLVAYDPQTGVHTSYNHPVNEPGGPIGATADGRIVVGTRGNAGYVLVFQPATQSFKSYKVPTAMPSNMKDGLTVSPDGQVWFTQSSANRIARLLIP